MSKNFKKKEMSQVSNQAESRSQGQPPFSLELPHNAPTSAGSEATEAHPEWSRKNSSEGKKEQQRRLPGPPGPKKRIPGVGSCMCPHPAVGPDCQVRHCHHCRLRSL